MTFEVSGLAVDQGDNASTVKRERKPSCGIGLSGSVLSTSMERDRDTGKGISGHILNHARNESEALGVIAPDCGIGRKEIFVLFAKRAFRKGLHV
ncbi:MAG: hypothetical protein A4E58_00600 [Syntrophorhabdus sp. PtaB.Bin006]|nr:MAG: hypothetical protein A4E58_00600 [Syntrophorhabdus sp. PtaB.Bin006]